MLGGVHFLLTYKCTYECDHCFVYCSPQAEGVFTLAAVKKALTQMKEMESIDTAYFEGGEAFLYYPLLLESLRLAKGMGFAVGVVSNAYWAVSEVDAELWLRPLVDIGLDDLSISDDIFHNDNESDNPAKIAVRAAKKLGIPSDSICIEAPKIISDNKRWGGQPVVGGDVLFKGRAVDKLIDEKMPRQDYRKFTDCPHEELKEPERVHLDPFGNIHICQGLVIGNINQRPLKEIMESYRPEDDPIIGPLISGGPAALADKFGFDTSGGFVSHCHLCFEVRRALLDRFPDILAPKQVYGR
jgi:MoaA/NifB/PqqE/SkfB family radical SAM enzyme